MTTGDPYSAVPHLRWNMSVLGLDIALFVAGMSFSAWTTILPLYVRHLTSSNLVLGLIPAVRNLGLYLPPILVSPRVERLQRYKPFVLIWTLLERFPYLLLAASTLWLWPEHPTLLLVIFFLMLATWSAGGGITSPAWLHMVSLMVPVRLRGRFFGVSSSIGGLFGVGGAAATTVILRTYTFPTGFEICFAITFVFVVLSFIALALGRESTWHDEPRDMPQPMLSYLRALPSFLARERNFGRFLMASTLGSVGVAVSPFLAVAASRELHASDATVAVYSTVLLAVSTAGSMGWGWVGDKMGYRPVLLLGTIAGVACMLFAVLGLTLKSSALFYLAFTALGAYSSAVQLSSFTIVTEFGTATDRPTFIALSSLVLAPIALCAPIAGGVIADHLGFGPVFAVSAASLAGATVIYRFAVRDPRAVPM